MTKRRVKGKEKKHHHRADTSNREGITIGDISGGTGFAIGHQAQSTVTQINSTTTDEIAAVFNALHQKVSALPDGPEKSVAQNAVQALEAEARKGEEATETQVQKWMKFLAETAPDAWEVAVDMFINPVKGIGTVFKKIADKAQQTGKNAKA